MCDSIFCDFFERLLLFYIFVFVDTGNFFTMKKFVILVAAALGLAACQTPADHFERVGLLNSKLTSATLKAISSTDAESYKKALDGVDGVCAELNSFERFSEYDSVYVYVSQRAQFASRALRLRQADFLEGGMKCETAKNYVFDSLSYFNDRIKVASIAFMKEYDLNHNFDID